VCLSSLIRASAWETQAYKTFSGIYVTALIESISVILHMLHTPASAGNNFLLVRHPSCSKIKLHCVLWQLTIYLLGLLSWSWWRGNMTCSFAMLWVCVDTCPLYSEIFVVGWCFVQYMLVIIFWNYFVFPYIIVLTNKGSTVTSLPIF
jgi:hypothetical protein